MIPRRPLLAALLAATPAAARIDLGGLALPVKQDDTVAPGYRRDVLVRWGDRVTFDAPGWNPAAPTAEGAATQFGWDARVAAIAVPQQQAADGVPRAVLAVTHPTVEAAMAWPQTGAGDRPALAAAMQGASLLNLEKQGRRWLVVDGGYQSRRFGANTLCRLPGPVAGAGSVQGVLGLSGGSATPWGTLLLAEGDPAPWLSRLRGQDARAADAAGFGWVLEVDPFNPNSVPVKRTGLGRFAHGDVAATLSRDGRAVVYMTDRRVGGFLFRFVSAGPATQEGALDAGTLAVARLQAEQVRWLPLPPGAAILVNPVAAAQQAGGTFFDTPSGLGLDPTGPRLLLACHGSPARPSGHVIEISAQDGDDAAEVATALLLFAAGHPQAGGRYGPAGLPPGSSWPENPDTVMVDGRGRAWIGTDRGGRIGVQAEGLYATELDGPQRGVPVPIYGAPRGASIGGTAATPDGETLFVAVRHPGAEPGARYDRPATRWPAFEQGTPPRTTLIGLVRSAGGTVGG